MQFTHFTESPLPQAHYQLPVTQADIDKAMKVVKSFDPFLDTALHTQYCPIAFALKATGRFKRIYVKKNFIFIDSHCLLIDAHSETAQFIKNFDTGYPIQPITASFYIEDTFCPDLS